MENMQYPLSSTALTARQVAQFCIHRFCKHPEHQETLIAEALKYQGVAFGSLNKEMPYLDSFLKETARLSPGPVGELIPSCDDKVVKAVNLHECFRCS